MSTKRLNTFSVNILLDVCVTLSNPVILILFHKCYVVMIVQP